MSEAPHLPVAADWFSLTWVTARTAVMTEPHMDDLLRAGIWYLRGRDRDLLVDTGNGAGELRPYLARLARSGRPRDIVCVCTHAHIDHIGGFHEFERRLLHPAEPELAANAMLCAVNQAAYLLHRQVEQQGRDFVEQGGFTERLYAARTKAQAEKEPAAPACPVCGKKMRKRTAGKGPHAGRSFWGCSGYPECKGTLKIENLPDGSDSSDKLK